MVARKNVDSDPQHDCDHNCELFRTGRYITFRVIKPILLGQEITAHYGDGYCNISLLIFYELFIDIHHFVTL